MARVLGALVARSLARSWRGIAGIVLVLSAFQVAAVLIAASLERSRTFAQLAAVVPAFVGQAVGGTVQMVASFGGTVAFGFFHPVVILAVVQGAIYLASEPADEIERGLVDLVAARPLPRHLLVTRALVAATLGVAMTVLTMMAASVITVRLAAPAGARALGVGTTALLGAHLSAVALCFAGASLLVSAYARRRAAAVGGIGLLAVFLFLVDVAAASWATLAPLAPLTPFYYFKGMSLLLGTTSPSRDLAVLLTVTMVLVAWAYVAYSKRDL
jgi:ABC-type transport system involved in multi-copper enzyme maturation permease subunit